MNLEITQKNLYLILPSKVCWMAGMLSEDKGISIANAMKRIYDSDVYRRLELEKTKLWNLGPVALYDEFNSK
jgi:hypothetical protein